MKGASEEGHRIDQPKLSGWENGSSKFYPRKCYKILMSIILSFYTVLVSSLLLILSFCEETFSPHDVEASLHGRTGPDTHSMWYPQNAIHVELDHHYSSHFLVRSVSQPFQKLL